MHAKPYVLASILLAAVAAGCDKSPEIYSHKQAREIMGTFAEVTAVAPSKQIAVAAVEAAYAKLSDVNDLMSDYVADSEVGQLNALPAGKMMAVSPETFEVITKANEIAKLSGGALDITCRPLVSLWKQSGKAGHLPDEQELKKSLARVGYEKILLNEQTRGVGKSVDGMQIDLGAIAKGYSLDIAASAMREAGAVGGLVNVGGDVRGFGRRDSGGDDWIIGVQDPFGSDLFGKLAIRDCAVATSGVQQRFVVIDGKRYSHIVDPRTGLPAQQAPSVTVIAPDGASADGWATVFSVLTVEEGQLLVDKLDGVEVLWIWGTKEKPHTAQTPGFAMYCRP